MLFQFLTYLQATHYFSLKKNTGYSVFPKAEALPNAIQAQLERDIRYTSVMAQDYDLSWQALHQGYVGDAECISDIQPLPIVDNYRFIRKYFHVAWVYYVFVLRVLHCKNPIKEFLGLFKSRDAQRVKFINLSGVTEAFEAFDSDLLHAQPKVSVIIPTLNRYLYLKDVLLDLELQDYKNFEVIVIDQSEPFQNAFYEAFDLDIKVHYQEEKALWLARNSAIRMSEGEYLLLFDDDSRVSSDWISSHLKCLDFFNASISSGVSISKVGAETPAHYSFFRISDQLDTGNVMLKKSIFKSIGLFDRQFEKQRMGDGEFGLRAYLHNYLNVSNPFAKRLHLKVDSGGLRQMGSWDAFRTSSLVDPRPIPSVLYFFRSYFGNNAARYALLRTIPISVLPYRFKKNKPMLIIGVLLSILLMPVILMQVLRSWRLASVKLREGARIEKLGD